MLMFMFFVSVLSACTNNEEVKLFQVSVEQDKAVISPIVSIDSPITLTIAEPLQEGIIASQSATKVPLISMTPLPTHPPRPSITPTISPPPIVRVGPNNIPFYINPLTGLVAKNPFLLERRPLAVKIALFPLSALPPSGASLADHIYEYYLESGLSRWIGIFYGNDASKVGPVRSARIFDVEIVKMYQSAFIFNGAYKNENIEKLDVFGYLEEHLDQNYFIVEGKKCEPYLCRDGNIPGYNNLFGNTDAMSNLIVERGIDNSRPDLESNYFYSVGIRSKLIGERIYTYYSFQSYNRWDYDETTERYLRFQGNSYESESYLQLFDRSTEQPIGADNVVYLLVPHEFHYKSSDSEIFDINLSGTGDGFVFRDGLAYKVRWQRTASEKPISIQTISGSSFPLKPGTTFFEIINTTSNVRNNQGDWIFEFQRPEDDSYEAEPKQD